MNVRVEAHRQAVATPTSHTQSTRDFRLDPLVEAYSWSIVGTHWVAYLFFLTTNILNVLLTDTEPICWPYLESCWQFRTHNGSQLFLIQWVYLLILVAATRALSRRDWKWFTASVVAANIFLMALISLDYRLRANEFYMLLWLNAAFLLGRPTQWCVPCVVVSFYFWAGALKVNYEWLSGAGLYRPLWLIPAWLTPVACGYVVCLEMVLVWGLLAKNPFIFWSTLAQLALFHLQSLSQIHWFYPLLMVVVLSWFVLHRIHSPQGQESQLSVLCGFRAPKQAYATMAVFGLFQMVPLLYDGDQALTGQGRLFALHMFEARQVCDVKAVLHSSNGRIARVDLQLRTLPPRIICDPIVYFDRAKTICRTHSYEATDDVVDLDLVMDVRRTTDVSFRRVINEMGVCNKEFTYMIFSNNKWLH